MATLDEVLSFAKGLADTGQGVDLDNVYGTQCVDLPNWITTKYFSIALWGNAQTEDKVLRIAFLGAFHDI